MGKTFKELQPGDTFYIWWYNRLMRYKIEEITPDKAFLVENGEEKEVTTEEFTISCEHNHLFHIMEGDANSETVLMDHDVRRYKIYGTSKKSIESFLKKLYERDIEDLKDEMTKVLKRFVEYKPGQKIWFNEEKKPYVKT